MWKESEGLVLFECKVVETGQPCLTGGWVQLSSSLSKQPEKEVNAGSLLGSDAIFEKMSNHLATNPKIDVEAIFRWIIIAADKQPKAQWGTYVFNCLLQCCQLSLFLLFKARVESIDL